MLSHIWFFGDPRDYPTRLLCPWEFPGKNTGVGCHFLLQGVFPTQGSNPCLLRLLHWQVVSLSLSHLGIPLEKDMGQEIHQAQQLHLHERPRSHPSAQFFCPLTQTGGEWLPQWEPRCLWVLLRCHSPFSHQTFYTVLCRPKVHMPTDSSPSQVQLHTTTEAGTTTPNYLNCFQTHQDHSSGRSKSTQAFVCVAHEYSPIF